MKTLHVEAKMVRDNSKVWHSTSKYRRTIWQCNHKFKNDKKCKTPHLYEDTLKDTFLECNLYAESTDRN